MKHTKSFLLLCSLTTALGCHAAATPADAGSMDAGYSCSPLLCPVAARLYDVLGGDVANRESVIADLKAVTLAEPQDGRAFLLYGMAMLSALAEDNDANYVAEVDPALQTGKTLLPDDERIPGWIGILHVQLAVVLNGPDTTNPMVKAAIDELTMAADLYPDFNDFDYMLMSPLFALSTGIPEQCIARAKSIAGCGATDSRCRNSALVPHNVEGALMTIGDLYARVGDKPNALSYYNQALATPDSVNWKFRSIAMSDIANIDSRIAGFAQGGAGRPSFFSEGKTSCVGCHGR